MAWSEADSSRIHRWPTLRGQFRQPPLRQGSATLDGGGTCRTAPDYPTEVAASWFPPASGVRRGTWDDSVSSYPGGAASAPLVPRRVGTVLARLGTWLRPVLPHLVLGGLGSLGASLLALAVPQVLRWVVNGPLAGAGSGPLTTQRSTCG